MKEKTYYLVTATILLIVAVVHALRVVLGWQAVIGNYAVPQGFSVAGVLLAGYLAYAGMQLYRTLR